MNLDAQLLREILSAHPQAEAIDPKTGQVFFGSQRMGNYYVPGHSTRNNHYGQNPATAPGGVPVERTIKRWQCGLPSIGV